MATGFTPPAMNWQAGSELTDEFNRFKQYCDLIFTGPFSKKTETERASYILLWIGRQGVDIYNSFTWANDDDKKKPEEIWAQFERYLAPKTNFRLARYQLQQLKQSNDETVDDFMTRCRNQANKCKFRDQQEIEERLIEQLIIGTKHQKAQERILEHSADLTLDKAIQYARTYEATMTHVAQLHNPSEEHVHAIGKTGPGRRGPKCGNCGNSHEPRKCPAYGTKCNFCSKQNHWSKMCRQKEKASQNSESGNKTQHHTSDARQNRRVHHMTASDEATQEFDNFHFDMITIDCLSNGKQKDEAFATLDLNLPHLNGKRADLKAKIDSGAQANILPLRIYKAMFPHNIGSDGNPKPDVLHKSGTTLTAYGGSRIHHHGTCDIECEKNGVKTTARFFIADAPGRAIIGLPTALELKLIMLNCSVHKQDYSPPSALSKESLLSQYPQCFNGIGRFQGEYHITLDPNVAPVIHPPRRVPISLKEDIKNELDSMIEQGIITKVSQGEPTSWVNSLVYRRKRNGNLRICLDPKDLNKAIQREQHATPTLEEILPKLNGAKYFSILDAKCGYWNVVLDEESSYLTTFNSPFGRYRFLRMPFGLRMSQDVFQAKIDQTFDDCQGVIGIVDDIVVYGKTEEEHDSNLRGMITRCENTGLKLNPEKCHIKQPEIKFFGIICSAEGIRPDPAKVSALHQMKPPQDQRELQTFLGLATYMGPFIPNLSTLTAPLREILKQGNAFQWNATYQEAFDEIKQSISTQVILSYFDEHKEVVLQVDASIKGLGAALIQDGKPIAFASKALTETETRYANIERELLAVVYGCERFHTYLYGRAFTVESDHKPLESIHLKHLTSAPPRLQRMLLRLQQYDLKIKYRPGKDMLIADALSRLSPEEAAPIEDMDVQVHEVYTQFSPSILDRIREATDADPELITLKRVVYEGWPPSIRDIPTSLRPFWSFRDEISIDDGIMVKGQRIMIPATLQDDLLQQLHSAHQGAEKTKLRARSSVYWRNMNDDIDKITSSCQTCQKHQASNAKEPLIPTEVPPRPWHTIATDLFHVDNTEYLLAADYYSKYPFVRKIPKNQSNSGTVINMLKQIFSEQGIPAVIRSDNGPHYNSKEFAAFAKEYDFKHVTISPHYSQSNGFIEKQVGIAKATLTKSKETRTDPNIALLCLRTTPIDNKLPSPAELLLGRKLRDNLPRNIQRSNDSERIHDRLQERQALQKAYYDRTARALPEVPNGATISIQNPVTSKWEPGTVKERIDGIPRSYIVSTDNGRELRRNRSHIRHIPEHMSHSPPVLHPPAIEPVSPPLKVNQAPPGATVTRSGRIIKPPQRFADE